MVINCGALGCLLTLLTANHKKSIKKEACWTISNITAGTKEQIQAVIDANILPPLVHLLQVRGCACVPALQHWTSLGGVLGRRCMAQESLGWQGLAGAEGECCCGCAKQQQWWQLRQPFIL